MYNNLTVILQTTEENHSCSEAFMCQSPNYWIYYKTAAPAMKMSNRDGTRLVDWQEAGIDKDNMFLTVLVGVTGVIVLLLSIASTIFSLVSWCVLPKWRQFRHYVFGTTIFTFLLFIVGMVSSNSENLQNIVAAGTTLIFMHWLVVTTVMFYVEFVKVFMSFETMRFLYLKVNAFGWLLPISLSVLYDVSEVFDQILAIEYFMLLLVNIVLYLCVLWALWRQARAQGVGIRTKVILSTFAFFCSGGVHILPFFIAGVYMECFGIPSPQIDYVMSHTTGLMYVFVMLTLNIFFLMLKSHRQLWAEHWEKKRQARINAASIPN